MADDISADDQPADISADDLRADFSPDDASAYALARANARALNAIAYSSAIGHADAKPDAAAYHEKPNDRP